MYLRRVQLAGQMSVLLHGLYSDHQLLLMVQLSNPLLHSSTLH